MAIILEQYFQESIGTERKERSFDDRLTWDNSRAYVRCEALAEIAAECYNAAYADEAELATKLAFDPRISK